MRNGMLFSKVYKPSITIIIISLWLALNASATLANQQAVDWLLTAKNQDGSVSSGLDIVEPLQSTSESITALLQFNHAVSAETYSFISANVYSGNEYLSRKIIAGSQAKTNVTPLIQQLLKLQNNDGGFGELEGYQSTPIDTAFALKALSAVKYLNDSVLRSAVTYLIQTQKLNGSYPLNSPNQSDIYETAFISTVLQKYALVYDVNAVINKANDYLLSKQIQGAGWGSHWETAAALIAIIASTSDTSRYQDSLNSLISNQSIDGSWNSDVYITSVALQAINLASSKPVNTDTGMGRFMGTVVDSSSGLPISGVTVRLIEDNTKTVKTVMDGSFLLTDIMPGQYNITYQYNGYTSSSQQVSVTAGEIKDLGLIQLNTDQATGILSGIVTDSTTGAAISGAVVTIVGSTASTAMTDTNGVYSVVGVPESITITVTVSGYQEASASGQITAGAVTTYSPALLPTGSTNTNQQLTIKGRVLDAETSVPVSGVLIDAGNAQSVVSTVSGGFELVNIAPGELTLSMTHTDYRTSQYSVFGSAGSIIDLGDVYLSQLVVTTATSLSGVVIDAQYLTPVEGARVAIEGIAESVVTLANGKYLIENIPSTQFTATVSALGYITKKSSVSFQQAGNNHLNFEI